jgi:HK97 family phage major capsid protein
MRSLDLKPRDEDFLRAALCLLRTAGRPLAAVEVCAVSGWRDSGADLYLRSAASAMSTSDSAPLAALNVIAAGFVEALRPFSAFDQLLGAARRVPMHSALSIFELTGTGGEHLEGGLKPGSQFTVGPGTLSPHTVATFIVASDTLLKMMPQSALAVLRSVLPSAAARDSDAVALPLLMAGLSPIASSGVDAKSVAADVAALLAAVEYGSDAQLRLVVHVGDAKILATMVTDDGARAFPNMSPTGGSLCGVGVIVSGDDSLVDSSGRSLLLVDASQLAADATVPMIDASSAALLQLDTAPTSGASAVNRSMFQENETALRVERRIAIARLRDTAAALVTGTSYEAATP